MDCGPKRIVLLDHNEFALYEIERRLRDPALLSGVEVQAVLGSVGDPRLVARSLARWSVDTVIHAAAYKHVPLVETNPMVGMVNNVLGTQTLAEQALRAGVGRFLLLSTDKAVRPANVMGASKRLAEQIICTLARRPGPCRFATVRFGNVWGSSGSVVPLFAEQIAAGGPLTVTHPHSARYFLSIEQATMLVLEAGALANRGEIFVPDMGKPQLIEDIARRMMADAGADRLPLVYSGLRPGEKLQEELSLSQRYSDTAHPALRQTHDPVLTGRQTSTLLRHLREALLADSEEALHHLIATWVEGPATAEPPQEALRLTS
ncbi:MAG: polysaccharide biosynthesis protein [Sulfitobacter sp.]|nr:polysaccharide biosynthesis protein [Sulfitobacter sp.]